MNRHERIRMGGAVRRYHTRTTIGHQSVAEHSWGVAAIILEICENPSVNLLKAALYHDVAEYDTGDVPAQAKRALRESYPRLAEANDEFEASIEHELGIDVELEIWELAILKFADTMELLWYVIDQRSMGNCTLGDIWVRGCNYITFRNMPDTVVKAALHMYDELKIRYANDTAIRG